MTERQNVAPNDSRSRFTFLAKWRFSEFLALGAICALGVAILTIHLCTWGAQARRESKFNAATPCVVERRAAREKVVKGEKLYRPEVTIRYEYDGESYSATTFDLASLSDSRGFTPDKAAVYDALKPYYRGLATICWARRDDPSQVVLVKKSNVWGWVFLIIPSLLIFSGVSLLFSRIYDLTYSKEARASAKRGERKYPSLPFEAEERPPRPGGKYRELSPNNRGRFLLRASTFGAVLWNAASWVVFVFIFAWNETFWNRVGALIFCLVFCGIGFIFACRLWGRRRFERLAGTSKIALSTFPIIPGRRVKASLGLVGKIEAKRLDVLLRCEEIARHTEGNDVVVERREVYSSKVFTKFDVRAAQNVEENDPFEFIVPIGAMHSFHSEHNEIAWELKLQMEFADGGIVARDYEIVVLPFAPRD